MKPGITIFYLRHGETGWNAIRRIQGQMDSTLNDRGRAQAARNGRLLKTLLDEPKRWDYVASPLSRTSETMQIVRRELGLAPDAFRRDDRLKESAFGTWEGHMWGEIKHIDPEGFAAREQDPYGWAPPGGETYDMVTRRLCALLEEIERDTVIVSHGIVSRCFRGHVLKLSPAEIVTLEVPQDKVMRARAGSIEWL